MLRLRRHVTNMNWQQRFTAATPEERELAAQDLLERIHTQHSRYVLVNGRLVRERRRRRAHFIGERRGINLAWRRFYLISFAMILLTISVATWLIALHVPPVLGAIMVFLYDLLMLAILIRKPYRLKTS